MTATATTPATQAPGRADLAPWLIVALGLAIMYVPSFIDLFRTIWSTDEQAHGPIVLGLSVWLLWRKWPDVMAVEASARAGVIAWVVLTVGALAYALGRSQEIYLFEIGSVVWMVAGIVLLFKGISGLRLIWFALFFMLFMIPLPGFIVDTLTQPMKMAVSWAAENILFTVGYPIARSGVILQIGQYQLLVADACAGLHTLFTLEALGLLYLNVVRHASAFRNIALAILIVPISFSANVIRVMVLSLITYHFGDEAGQGFLHGFSGMVLFVSALLLIIGADSVLRFGAAQQVGGAPVKEQAA
ncbi:MAG: exosortase B [Denitromonas halophila]|nr:MAG: exosortase B [Denitromonas halophila]TVT66557.1 MAG: exosortase B [Denitromonas halophila]